MEAERLPLRLLNGPGLKIRKGKYAESVEQIEEFLNDQKHLNTLKFANDVMFSHELQANNQIEGIRDDVSFIKRTIENKAKFRNDADKLRILNLYDGYRFILKRGEINKESLKKLYAILSKNLLDYRDSARMGDYYREGKVYILKNGRLDTELDEGLPEDKIDEFMNAYFEFLNNNMFSESLTSEYIKSQILHFYFVYIHPYFDVNGRTSRTLAMWYLLNKKCYPYIIFNRGITFKGSEYDRAIIDVKKYADISFFIDYMLKTVQIELEKEYIMQRIAGNTSAHLTSTDYQTLLYLLSMKGNMTVKDFACMYSYHNDKQKIKVIYESMILPLIDKGIIKVERTTGSFMFGEYHNEMLSFTDSALDYDHDKIKRLVKYR